MLRQRRPTDASATPLMVNVAQPIATRRPDDALAFTERSTGILTSSLLRTRSAAIAYVYTRKFDDATAITYLERALELDPKNGLIQGQLEQLKSYRRK